MVAQRFVARWLLLLVLACLKDSGLDASSALATDETAACALDEKVHNGESAEDCTTLLQLVTDVHVRSASPASGQVSGSRSASETRLSTPHSLLALEAHSRAEHWHSVRVVQASTAKEMVFGELMLAVVVIVIIATASAAFFFSDEGMRRHFWEIWRPFAEYFRRCWCCVPCMRIGQRLHASCQVCVRRGSWLFSSDDSAHRRPPDNGGGGVAGGALSSASSSHEAPRLPSFRNNLGRPPREDYQARLNSIDGRQRSRSVTLLFLGSSSSLLAFMLVAMLNIHRYLWEVQTNVLGEPFKSGHNYFPRTINEQIYEPRSARDRVFFCFGLLGSICLLLSWYPWELRNVYVSYQARFLCSSCMWLNVRQYVPPIGLFLISCVSTTPRGQDGLREQVTVYIHLLGMTMWVVGYIFAEAYTLYFTSIPDIRVPEKKIRKVCVIGCTVSTIIFELCSFVSVAAHELGICCTDDWHVPTRADITAANHTSNLVGVVMAMDAMEHKRRVLFNTAWGAAFVFKFIEYWMQILACLFICVSLLAIWWYCPERNMQIDEIINDVDETLLEREEQGRSPFAQALAGKMPRFPFLPIVRPGEASDANLEMSCSQCGTVFVPDSRFCDSCGAERRPMQEGTGR